MVTHQKSHCEITSHMVSHEGGSTYQLWSMELAGGLKNK